MKSELTIYLAIYAIGPVSLSCCAPTSWLPSAIEAEVNRISPPGGALSWRISDAKTFADGAPHPAPCQAEGRQHWLLHC